MGAGVGYQRLGRRRLMIVALSFLLLVISFTCDILTGPAQLPLSDILSTIWSPDSASDSLRTIIWTFRFPTALMALLVGASLGVAGAEMQTILNNPLASPFTLGISAAASFGAALALVFGAGTFVFASTLLVPGFAFASALFGAMMIYGIGRMRGGSTETLIVGGVALHFIFSSGVAFLQYVASDDTLQAIVFWIFGSLQGATWSKVAILCVVLSAAMSLLATQAWRLTALRLGDIQARSMGVDVDRLRLQTLALISILTATAVCFTGAIGFVGLVAPHLSRASVGEDQRYFLPLSALYGALLVSVAAVICKLAIPGAIFPIGIATAALGAPFFAALALLKRRAYW
ncbi:Fe(III) dicitrate ABC transporter, permease [Blastopirellula marina DSM 3645]|uniref:Fe(III) dicitrate ABC transporter, permease n=2 Tax=Blastopirellula marina TaxID=124 RepID=A3ZPB0_9BACT|nr:Fe(III) dicitrate ABC transporter, permease [Blastopirellula marina DSM 3645]